MHLSPSPVACNASNRLARSQNRCPSSSLSPTRNQGSSVVVCRISGSLAIPQPRSCLAEARRYNEDRWPVATTTKILSEGLAGHSLHFTLPFSRRLCVWNALMIPYSNGRLEHWQRTCLPDVFESVVHSGTLYPLYETFTPIGSTSPFPCAFASQSSLPSPIRNPLPTGGMKRAGIREQHLREQVRRRTIMRPPSSEQFASQRGRHPDMNDETSRGEHVTRILRSRFRIERWLQGIWRARGGRANSPCGRYISRFGNRFSMKFCFRLLVLALPLANVPCAE